MASRTLFQKIKNIFSRFKSLFYNDRRITLFRSVRFVRFDSFRLYDCLRRYNTYYCFLRRFLSLPRRVSDRFRTGNRIIARLRFRRIFRGHTADMGRFQPAAFNRGGAPRFEDCGFVSFRRGSTGGIPRWQRLLCSAPRLRCSPVRIRRGLCRL